MVLFFLFACFFFFLNYCTVNTVTTFFANNFHVWLLKIRGFLLRKLPILYCIHEWHINAFQYFPLFKHPSVALPYLFRCSEPVIKILAYLKLPSIIINEFGHYSAFIWHVQLLWRIVIRNGNSDGVPWWRNSSTNMKTGEGEKKIV